MPEPKEDETVNRFAVTAHDEAIVSVLLQRKWTIDEAVNLAAWLIVALDLADDDVAAAGHETAMARVCALADRIRSI